MKRTPNHRILTMCWSNCYHFMGGWQQFTLFRVKKNNNFYLVALRKLNYRYCKLFQVLNYGKQLFWKCLCVYTDTHTPFFLLTLDVALCCQIVEECYIYALMCNRKSFRTHKNVGFQYSVSNELRWRKKCLCWGSRKLTQTFINSKLHSILTSTMPPGNVFCRIKEIKPVINPFLII